MKQLKTNSFQGEQYSIKKYTAGTVRKMPLFPIFISLAGKKCVCIGGGNVASRKVEALLDFNADITVISPEINEQMDRLNQLGGLRLINREYLPGDLEGAFLAVAATSDRKTNEQVVHEAESRNILVNVVDSPEKCTFVFPSIVRRGDLVIGITTSGDFPILSKKVREKIELLFPGYYSDVLAVLKEYRKKAIIEIPDAEKRKTVMDKMLEVILNSDQDSMKVQLLDKINNIYKELKDEKDN